MFFFFYNMQIWYLKPQSNYNILELSHLLWYITIYNTHSKLFLALFYFSSLFWFFFSFFWTLPLQFTIASLIFVIFYIFSLHKQNNPLYIVGLYNLLPRGTHSYNLQTYVPEYTPTALAITITTTLKITGLGAYLGLFFLLYLSIRRF